MQKYAQIFVPLHNLFWDVNSFLKAKLRETLSFKEQIHPRKYTLACQIEAIVYLWSIKYFCLHDLSQGFKGLDIPQLKLGHYLFLEAHSFPWALLSKNFCILEQIISANKYPCIFFMPKKGYCLYIMMFLYLLMCLYESYFRKFDIFYSFVAWCKC